MFHAALLLPVGGSGLRSVGLEVSGFFRNIGV